MPSELSQELVVALVIATALLPCALVGLVIGWRGRRIDDHPLCRNCRQDLTGIAADTTACPECGHSVSVDQKYGVRFGNRAKSKGLLTTSAILLLISMVLMGGIFIFHARSINTYRYYPTAILTWQVDSSDRDVRRKASNELRSRSLDNELSPGQADAIIEKLLALQGEANSKWYAVWGDILVAEMHNGRFTESQRTRFLEQISVRRMYVRASVRAGSEFGIKTDASYRAGTTASGYYLQRKMIYLRVIDGPRFGGLGRKLFEQRGWDSTGGYTLNGYEQGGVTSYYDMPANMPPGKYELELVEMHRIRNGNDESAEVVRDPFEVRIVLPIEVVPPDKPAITLLESSNALDDEMQKSFEARASMYGSHRSPLYLTIEPLDPPMDAAFRVWIRTDGKEYEIGDVAFKHETANSHGVGAQSFDEIPSTVDVILRSDIAAAEKSVDLTAIWQGEIVLKNVPVQ